MFCSGFNTPRSFNAQVTFYATFSALLSGSFTGCNNAASSNSVGYAVATAPSNASLLANA